MQQLGDCRRHRGARSLVDEVVGECSLTDHLGGFQLAPRFRDVERVDLQHVTGEPALERIALRHRYHHRVFFTPPWPEIYATDAERRHDMDAAVAEYDRLLLDYPSLGYQVITVPKIGVSDRADFVLQTLTRSDPIRPDLT